LTATGFPGCSTIRPTRSLCELRGMLIRDHEWRVREGLV
jgi:hypothetical protein